MNRLHDRNLRALFGITDANEPVSDEARSRIERMETRMTRFFSRFSEIQAETLALVVNDLTDGQVFPVLVPEPEAEPEQGPSDDDIENMTPKELRLALVNLDVGMSGKESGNKLRDMLREALEQEQGQPEEAAEE